jgi:signal transduction histidine kinase
MHRTSTPSATSLVTVLKSRLFRQIAFTLVVLIVGIEVVFLSFSVDSKMTELSELRQELDADAIRETGKTFNQLHPGILDDADIGKRLDTFVLNITLMSLLLTFLVVSGTLLVMYFIALRPLIDLINAIRSSTTAVPLRYTSRLPANEIGELIEARDTHLDLIVDYESRLQGQVGELRREIIQSEKMGLLGELSAGIIHDLNNPLQLLMFSLDNLESEVARPVPNTRVIRDAMKPLNNATDRIQALVQRMTGFLRKSGEQPAFFDLAESVEHSVELLQSRLYASGIALNVVIGECPALHGLRLDIEQALINLISNAVDALEGTEAPRIDVQVDEVSPGYLRLVVADNGPGIPEQIRPEVCKNFFTTKSENKGTGLGLANVQRIVEGHNGKIKLDSPPGEGARFSIVLPVNCQWQDVRTA